MPDQPSDSYDEPSSYLPYRGSGGGGAGGQYVFANVEDIDAIVTDLEALTNEIRDEDRDFRQAIELAWPPADDAMSAEQVNAYVSALQKGRQHNQAVVAYAENQLTKLRAARQAYVDADSGAENHLRDIDGAAG